MVGFELIAKGLTKLLKKYDIEEDPYSATFDPQLYEAVMQVPSAEHASGEIVAMCKKGIPARAVYCDRPKLSVVRKNIKTLSSICKSVFYINLIRD